MSGEQEEFDGIILPIPKTDDHAMDAIRYLQNQIEELMAVQMKQAMLSTKPMLISKAKKNGGFLAPISAEPKEEQAEEDMRYLDI